MNAADDAFREAQRLIAKARAGAAESLSFDTETTRALTRLPAEIATLDRLRDLDLDDAQVSDLTPLAGLTTLTTLGLHNTQVGDLTPLAGLSTLTTLSLNNTQVSDLTPLAGLTALTTLWLTNTQVSA